MPYGCGCELMKGAAGMQSMLLGKVMISTRPSVCMLPCSHGNPGPCGNGGSRQQPFEPAAPAQPPSGDGNGGARVKAKEGGGTDTGGQDYAGSVHGDELCDESRRCFTVSCPFTSSLSPSPHSGCGRQARAWCCLLYGPAAASWRPLFLFPHPHRLHAHPRLQRALPCEAAGRNRG